MGELGEVVTEILRRIEALEESVSVQSRFLEKLFATEARAYQEARRSIAKSTEGKQEKRPKL